MKYITLVIVFFSLIFDRLNIFLFLLISALLHEAGHILVCIALKTKPKISISPFGIKLCGYPQNKISKLMVLSGGPFANLLIIIIMSFLLCHRFSLNKYIFMCINIVIMLFNLLPIHFLDGGQIILLFCDSKIIRNIMDICGFIVLAMVIFVFSDNILLSLSAFGLFVIYYLINKKCLHLF